MRIKRLAIIGVGLIGGSLALALKKAGVVDEVVGCGRQLANLEKAKERHIIDTYTQSIKEAVTNADMIFIAVPLGAIKGVFQEIKGHLLKEAIITDGGSAKQQVIKDCLDVFGQLPPYFIAGHPIAGTENSGASAALDNLYEKRRVILTPHKKTNSQALEKVQKMWQICGAEVINMDAKHHDEVLAATSHLPHLLAFGLVDSLAAMKENDEIFQYAAGGFRDFTRIASSNPEMWRDICLANKSSVSLVLKNFIAEMNLLLALVENEERDELENIFKRAKTARDRYIDHI